MAVGKLQNGLRKTREKLRHALRLAELSFTKDFDRTKEEIEELLLSADVGIAATGEITHQLHIRRAEYTSGDAGMALLESILSDILTSIPEKSDHHSPPLTILTAGVNGTGKTTSVAKLAKRFKDAGEHVLLVASDTYRPAGIEQLCIWGDRVGVEVLKSQLGQDPASVAYDAISSALSKKFSVVIIDTAGRLHTNTNLLEELMKIRTVLSKKRPDLPQETYLILDATTGQNGLAQAQIFKESLEVTGVILTKLDGTAKGGIIFAIAMELGIPVRYIGVGEDENDLLPFDPRTFIQSLLPEREQI
jgi:fused signal recognition particle receptor